MWRRFGNSNLDIAGIAKWGRGRSWIVLFFCTKQDDIESSSVNAVKYNFSNFGFNFCFSGIKAFCSLSSREIS